MCAVTHRAKSYQLVLLIKNSRDDVIDTQQSACEAILQFSSLSVLYLQNVPLIHLKDRLVRHILNNFG